MNSLLKRDRGAFPAGERSLRSDASPRDAREQLGRRGGGSSDRPTEPAGWIAARIAVSQ
jgi:hypothetical protein